MLLQQIKQHIELEQMSGPDRILLMGKDRKQELKKIEEQVALCKKCDLSKTRTHTVFGEGDIKAKLMFIGDAPGADEDKAGKLLSKMIQAMELERDQVFIANILKCCPPDNRNPLPEEIKQCLPYLENQISLICPKIICTLGAFATQTLLDISQPIASLRGKSFDYQGKCVIPTFHPTYLLRNEGMKRLAWQDLQFVLTCLKD